MDVVSMPWLSSITLSAYHSGTRRITAVALKWTADGIPVNIMTGVEVHLEFCFKFASTSKLLVVS
jgi:hypothetical protein